MAPDERYDSELFFGENPTNIDVDLNRSFPQPGAIFDTNVPKNWFKWKENLYKTRGIKLGFSYQSSYLTTTDSLLAEDTAWGGWLLLEGKWDLFNTGQANKGGIVMAVDWRHTIGGYLEPFLLLTSSGSLWPHDAAQLEWDPWLPALYWEQHVGRENDFVLRFGNQAAGTFIDFFRYKDPRVSFTGSPHSGAQDVIPAPAPGPGASFRWKPIDDSEFYIVGTINDMNAVPAEFNWDNTFDFSEFFYAAEFGMNWRRSPSDFDHVHLTIYYADDRTGTQIVPGVATPQKGGAGFKLAGEKQWDRVVGFGSYAYNDAEGGPFSTTLTKQQLRLGFAVNRPLNVNGEVGFGFTWSEPIEGLPLVVFPQRDPLKDQYGVEMYWRMLITNDLWVTPSLQVIVNPTYNPDTESIIVPGLKFRFFL